MSVLTLREYQETPNKERSHFSKKRKIYSKCVSYKNPAGATIVGRIDYSEGSSMSSKSPFVILVPGYAETKKDQISLSFYLVSNGFRVLRYDNTNQLGESDGDIVDTDPLKMRDDLTASLDYIQQFAHQSAIPVIASSVASRVAFKVASQDKRVSLLISLVGVVDVQKTLTSIYREDLIAKYRLGKRWTTIDILGHEVKSEFLRVLIEGQFHDLRTTLDDVKHIDIPLIFIAAQDDAWVSIEDVKEVFRKARNLKSEFHVVAHAMHQLQENPRVARDVIWEVVKICLSHTQNMHLTIRPLKVPAIHDITVQNKIELSIFQSKRRITREEEKEFWSKYLDKFSVIFRSPDYQNFLTCTERAISPINFGEKLLDAGCGTGHFGVWLLKRIMENCFKPEMTNDKPHLSWSYIGVDFVESALDEASVRHQTLIEDIRCKRAGYYTTLQFDFKYIVADLEIEIPLSGELMDKIVCNLVLSYVSDPLHVLKNLTNVLKPGGIIVISSLKPYCDLSLIYRNFAQATVNEKELDEARALLSSSGKIRQKETEGHYYFFAEDELANLVGALGLELLSTFRTLGNQVNLVTARKPGH